MAACAIIIGRARTWAVAVVAMILLWALRAGAYNVEIPIAHGCHEDITSAALRQVRSELATAGPLPSSGDDDVIMEDLPFPVPADLQDIGAVSLLLGVRDNDLKGRSSIDVSDLAMVHGDPDTQIEHCLRRPEHDEPTGSDQALADWRSFVRRRFDQALGGLHESGAVDPQSRVHLLIALAFSGVVHPPLPAFYVRMGQALHALQDSFSHTFRTADGHAVTVVLNWVDVTEQEHHEPRDGPPHMSALDACDDSDALLVTRRRLALEASAALLRAGLDPDLSVAGKRAAAADVLQRYAAYEPGCTYDNHWCDAPENAYRDAACACRQGPRPAPLPWLGLGLFGFGLLAWAGRRHRRRRAGRPRSCAAPALAAVLLPGAMMVLTQAPAARAEAPAKAEAEAPAEAGTGRANDKTGIGLHLGVGGAFDNGALAFAVAGRYGITRSWLIGLGGEYNPWFSLEGERFTRGAFNGYGTVIYRYAIGEKLSLRTTLHVGTSVLLFDLVGAPKGSVGLFLGMNILGLAYELADSVYLIVDPADVAVPVPQIAGVPFVYRQYRLTLGLQIGS